MAELVGVQALGPAVRLDRQCLLRGVEGKENEKR